MARTSALLLLLLGCPGTDSSEPHHHSDTADSGCAATLWYTDADGDGFGGGEAVESCETPAGSVAESGDCDDADPAAWPGAPGECRVGRDLDCDGVVAAECVPADADLTFLTGDGRYGSTWDCNAAEARADVDGDGLSDIVVGCPSGGYQDEQRMPGYVYVLLGVDIAAASPGAKLEASVKLENPTRRFAGHVVTGIGDIDGDGGDEVFVGGGGPLDNWWHYTSTRQVIFSDEFRAGATDDEPGFGVEEPDYSPLGYMPVVLRDGEDPTSGSLGLRYTGGSKPGLLLLDLAAIAARPGWVEVGGEPSLVDSGERSLNEATTIAGPGGELLVTTWGSSTDAVLCVAEADLLADGLVHTRDESLGCTAVGSSLWGSGPAAASDLDGDGSADLVLSTFGPQTAGSIGAEVFSVEQITQGEGPGLRVIYPDDRDLTWGRVAGAPADLDGGGRADLVLSGEAESLSLSGGTDTMMVVFFGEELTWGAQYTLDDFNQQWRFELGAGAASVLAGGGDFNGDGAADLVMGSYGTWERSILFGY